MQKKNNPFPCIGRMFKDLFKWTPGIIFPIIVSIFACSIEPFLSVFLPKIAIGTIEAGGDAVSKNLIQNVSFFIAAAVVVILLSKYSRFVIEGKVLACRLFLLNSAIHKQMLMDYKYIEDSVYQNDIVNNAYRAVEGSNGGIEDQLKKIIYLIPTIISAIAMIVLTGTINPIILVAIFIHLAVYIFVNSKDFNNRYNKKQQLSETSRKVNYFQKISSDFTYGKDIRVYNFRDRIMNNYRAEINSYTKLITGMSNYKFALSFFSLFTLLATNVLIYGMLIYKTVNGMSISSFVMYTTLVTSLMATLVQIADDVSFVLNNSKYTRDFYDFIDSSTEDESGDDFVLAKDDTLEIVFDHVTFRYPGTERNILTDLNLKIKKGERLAIVGINGAGKSTIVKLITGLFSPTEGHIYINGKDITTINKKSLFNLYSAVFQEVNIMAFSIAENISGTDENIDRAKVQETLERVGLWKKISALENDMDHMLLKIIDENGVDFSGGERQKLCIARALYKESPMVIMDEPTAALDALAEAEIYQSFGDLVKGKTAVYVSHRLASTKFCDKIALFSKDGLIEYGNHDELMAKKGEYYNMFVIQGKYYQNQNNEQESAE